MIDVDLPIRSYAVAGGAPGLFPVARVCELPPARFHPRKARLPGLAVDMAERCLAAARGAARGAAREAAQPGGAPVGRVEAVLFGTAIGGMTETAAFVDRMILDAEQSPMPRAFSDSVLSAPATRIAMALEATGECQTFVQGAASFAQALFAAGCRWRRGARGRVIVGGADEVLPYVREALAAWPDGLADAGGYAALVPEALEGCPAEGGAVVLCGGHERDAAPTDEAPHALPPERPVAVLRRVAIGRPRDQRSWIRRALAPLGAAHQAVDLVLVDGSLRAVVEEALGPLGAPCRAMEPWTGAHPSRGAIAAALAIALVCGEARLPGLAPGPRSIAVVAASRWGDLGAVVLSAPPEADAA